MKPAVLLAFLAATSTLAASPAANDARLKASLKRQADTWDVAIVKKDRKAIAANMADSFLQIDSEGGTADKQHFVDGIVSDDLTIAPYTVDDLTIRIYGNTAIINGSTAMHGTWKGKPFASHYRYTDTYVKQGSAWRVVNIQTTPIK